jgi:plasmid stabilization system protein ParE
MKLRWTERARSDLLAVAEFIGRDNRQAALSWLSRLRKQAQLAAEHPFAGRVVPECGRKDIREVFLRSYRIVYLVGEEEINVLTVFEGHRSLDRDSFSEHEE